jgi:hypothetical protein
MAKKDLQEKYEELFGVAPEEALTVKQLEEAIDSFEEVPDEEAPAENPAKGRVTVGYL